MFDDALDAMYVDELERERAAARGVDPVVAVAVGQPHQLLRAAELGPRAVAGQQLLGELADVVAAATRVADHPVRIAPGVRLELVGVVVVVGGATARRLCRVCLDQRAVGVQAHEPTIAAHPERLADEARRDRVQRLAEAHVVVGVHLALPPHRRVEALAGHRAQRSALDLLEHSERALARRAVHAHAGDVVTPANRLALHVRQIDPCLAAEEAVAHVRHAALDVRLAGRVAHDRGVDDEAAVVRVLLERALHRRVVAVRLGDRRLEIVQDDAGGNATEELPRRFEAVDQVGQLLRVRHVHVLMTAVHQRHDQRPHRAPAAGLRIEHESQATEVDLGELAGLAVGDAHRDPPLVGEPAVLDGEPVQRAVRHVDVAAPQQLLDLGEPQTALAVGTVEPRFDLRAVRQQLALDLTGRRCRSGPQRRQHRRRQRLVGLVHAGHPAQLLGRRRPPAHRLATVPGRPGYLSLLLAAAQSPQHTKNLPHADLSIRHRKRLLSASTMAARADLGPVGS